MYGSSNGSTDGDAAPAPNVAAAMDAWEQALDAFKATFVDALAKAMSPQVAPVAVRHSSQQKLPTTLAQVDDQGAMTYTVHTDRQGRTFHLLVRPDGSVSFYFTTLHGGFHAVLWDSLDSAAWCAPDWSQAPPWAKAHALLPDGRAAWFELHPQPYGNEWSARGGKAHVYDLPVKPCIWWRSSVTTRPDGK